MNLPYAVQDADDNDCGNSPRVSCLVPTLMLYLGAAERRANGRWRAGLSPQPPVEGGDDGGGGDGDGTENDIMRMMLEILMKMTVMEKVVTVIMVDDVGGDCWREGSGYDGKGRQVIEGGRTRR